MLAASQNSLRGLGLPVHAGAYSMANPVVVLHSRLPSHERALTGPSPVQKDISSL
jgi:hypothetical protein